MSHSLNPHLTVYFARTIEKMGNSVSQRDFQCSACYNSFEIHELIPIRLCAHDFDYIRTLLKGDALRGWSKKQIVAFILFISFGSYYFGKSRSPEAQLLDKFRKSELKIRTLASTGKDFYFGYLTSGLFIKQMSSKATC